MIYSMINPNKWPIFFQYNIGGNLFQGNNTILNWPYRGRLLTVWPDLVKLDYFQSLLAILKGLFIIWQNFKPTLAQL